MRETKRYYIDTLENGKIKEKDLLKKYSSKNLLE